MCTHTHTHIYKHVKHAKYDTMKLVTCSFLTCIFSMYARVCPKWPIKISHALC